MPLRARYLLVLSLVSGDSFEDMPTARIVAEAKLGPKVLCTDPVKHYKNPQFVQELAWDLDRKSLRLFRLYRRSIRLRFFILHGDKCPRKKDPLGYIVLDLREATQRKRYDFCADEDVPSSIIPSYLIFFGGARKTHGCNTLDNIQGA
ncbi:hypothetical protein TcWFU_008499 [Taenia crassiceps]|uniref:C2 domain-containing protein n=1 Tax=Taenia crassiceps TaxID=6207 RepID=A0ABR4QMJ4_9CEST